MSEMIPLSVPSIKGNEWKYIKECLDTEWVSSAGKYVDKFEKAICRYTGAKYAVACVNGTSGLQVALQLTGIEPNNEVIVPDLTFIAPVNVVKYLNAEPVFMDCDDYMNIDAEKLYDFFRNECEMNDVGLKNKKSGRIIKAIIPVHIFGNPCNMAQIMEIAKKYDLKVVEDATESLGAFYTEGVYKNRFTGTIGDLGVYSFNGNKIITAGGGGMIVTNDEEMAKKAKYLTTQAKDDPIRYIHNEIGYNFRMTNLQAALGIAQLENLDDFIKVKKGNFELYEKELKNVDGIKLLGIPKGTSSNYWFYSLIIEKNKYGMDREELMQKLNERGIQTRPIWRLNHLQKPYLKNQSFKIEKALWFWKKALNIPCSSNLTEKEIVMVASAIKSLKE